MSSNNIYNKFRREIFKPLSKLCLKKAKSNYFGLKLNVPILHGIGAGFLVPSDKWMSDCLAAFLKLKDGSVVDIGVNIGLYLVKLKALDPKRNYIGFEPNSVCNYYTQELVRANNFENVKILPFALSNKKELRTFYVRRKADKMGSLNEYARFGETEKHAFDLFTFPADDFFEQLQPEKLCILKIDVEGSELEVLEGLSNTIKKYSPFIFCEIWQLPEENHPTYKEKHSRLVKICNLLDSLNYRIIAISKKSSSDIKVLNNANEFTEDYRRDYILAHKSDVDRLSQELKKI